MLPRHQIPRHSTFNGKRKTPAKDEVNEFDKACLNLLQKKLNTDADTHFSVNIVENLNNLPPKKKISKKKNNDSFN